MAEGKPLDDIADCAARDFGLARLDALLPQEADYLREEAEAQYGWGDVHPDLVPRMTALVRRFGPRGGEALWLLLHCTAFARDARVGAHPKDDNGLSRNLPPTTRAAALIERLWGLCEHEEHPMDAVSKLGIVEPLHRGAIPAAFLPYLPQFEARFGDLAPTLLSTYADRLENDLLASFPAAPLLTQLYAWAEVFPLSRYPGLAGEAAQRAAEMAGRRVHRSSDDARGEGLPFWRKLFIFGGLGLVTLGWLGQCRIQ